jgi:hypothetical protein
MTSLYQDKWIECTDTEISIRGYYFPWGAKRIPYGAIHSVRSVQLSALRGKGRIWGSSNPHYWASLDPHRPRKNVGLVINVGKYMQPFITPDDAAAVEVIIRSHSQLDPSTQGAGRAPML